MTQIGQEIESPTSLALAWGAVGSAVQSQCTNPARAGPALWCRRRNGLGAWTQTTPAATEAATPG
jgi:hypothetical protein